MTKMSLCQHLLWMICLNTVSAPWTALARGIMLFEKIHSKDSLKDLPKHEKNLLLYYRYSGIPWINAT